MANGAPRPRTKAKATPRKKLRLLEVLVQPVFMVEDGPTLKRAEYAQPDGSVTTDHPVVTVPADEWTAYGERFAAEMAAWEKTLNEPPAPDG